ncbi:Der1-like family-domain-containing protein [Coniochaeta sp. 2T2.1]|nr:Der1-like family-domain-containing protein [Coniochaeta sp. 2T2.1]
MGLVSFRWFYFAPSALFQIPPGIWRPFTNFFITQPKIGLLLDPYFTYQYMRQLEVGNLRFPRKEDVLWYLLTVGTMIIGLNVYFTSDAFFLQGLISAMCYTAMQDKRGEKSNFFFFTVPAQAVPLCMILASVLMNPAIVPLQITGLVAAHAYDFLTRIYPEFGGGRNLLPTPAFLSYFVETPRFMQRAYGTAIRPQAPGQPSTGRSTGMAGSVLPDSWRSRGTGHRLG